MRRIIWLSIYCVILVSFTAYVMLRPVMGAQASLRPAVVQPYVAVTIVPRPRFTPTQVPTPQPTMVMPTVTPCTEQTADVRIRGVVGDKGEVNVWRCGDPDGAIAEFFERRDALKEP